MTDFFRYPRTPHLAWLGDGQPRGDKVLPAHDAEAMLSGEVVVEEKIDGANLGLSVSEDGELRAQNRGSYLAPGRAHPQFRPLWSWLAPRESALVDALWPDLVLFGEWCYAVHSVRYDRLPDWFLGFDVYDRASGRFWDTARRNDLLATLDLSSVPRLAAGRFTLDDLVALFGPSRLGSVPMEGVVVRREADGWTTARAKLVRPAFIQHIDTHWAKGPLQRNRLAADASP